MTLHQTFRTVPMTRSLARMTVTALLLALTLTLAACGESADHRLQRAQIALANNKADAALELSQSVLTERPDDQEAMLVKGEAQMRLAKLEEAKVTLEAILNKQPDNAKARRMMISWAFQRTNNLLNQSDFATNPQRGEEFAKAVDIGTAQAQWLATNDKSELESDFIKARLKLVEVARLRVLAAAIRSDIKSMEIDDQGVARPGPELRRIQRDTDLAINDARKMLRDVLAKDPRHFQAAELHLSLLSEAQDWPEILVLTQSLAKQDQIPANLAASATMSLINMPESVHPWTERRDVAKKLQVGVDPAGRNNTQWKITEARLALRDEKYEEAKPVLAEILKAEPHHQLARFLDAQVKFHDKDYQAAKEILQQLSTEVRSNEVHRVYGMALLETGDVAMAKEALRTALDLNPDDHLARQYFLRAQADAGTFNESAAEVDAYYNRNPTDPRAIRFKVQFEQTANRPNVIAEVLRNVENIRPLTVEHVAILVDGYMAIQENQKAEQWARELISRQPNEIANHLRLAQVMLLLNRDDEVRQMLTELRNRFPDITGVDQMLAELYLQRGAFDKAVALMEPVVAKEPGNARARATLARGLASLSLYDDALSHVNKILEDDPKNAEMHLLAVRIYQAMGNNEKANEHLVKVDPQNVNERSNPALLAMLKVRQGELREASDIANRALASGNPDPTLRQILALVALKQKDPNQAEANLQALVRSQPNNAQAWAILGRFYVEQQMFDRGLLELTKLQPLNEVISRLTQSAMLTARERYDQALRLLEPIYAPAVKNRDKMALAIADATARVYLAKKDRKAASAVYDALIKADLSASEANLRKIDMETPDLKPEQIAQRLDAIAKTLPPDQTMVRLGLIQRYLNVGRDDRALALSEEWIAMRPSEPGLYLLKSQVLMRANRLDESVKTLVDAIKAHPQEPTLYRQLAAVRLVQRDYPGVEAAYRDMAKLDEASRITALAELGQLFVGLGLDQQAASTFDQLELEGRVHDPRVILAMGRALWALDRNEQARERLLQIPEYAAQYATGQVIVARIEQGMGKVDEARKRLEAMAGDARFVGVATNELLTLDLRNAQSEQLLRWSQEKLATEGLTPQMRMAWYSIRVGLADRARDYERLLQELELVNRDIGVSPQVIAARIVTLVSTKRGEQGRQLYLNTPALNDSWYGPMMAAMLGEPSAKAPDKYPPFDAFIIAMSRGDLEVARKAVEKTQSMRTIFRSDLDAIISRPDASSVDMRNAFRQLAAARVAMEVKLPRMAADICEGITKVVPSLTPAYSLWAEALLAMQEPLDPLRNRIFSALPTSTLSFYFQAQAAKDARDYPTAATAVSKIVALEPDNQLLRYFNSQMLTEAGKYDEAIKELQLLYAQGGPLQLGVANDLGYLLAEHQPGKLDEAYSVAQAAWKMSDQMPALLDTMGWIEYRRGNKQAALDHLTKAIPFLSNVPEVHYHLGVVYRDLGNVEWARRHLERAAQDKPDNKIRAKAAEELAKLPK